MKFLAIALALSMFGGVPLMSGCDRTVEEKKEQHTDSKGRTVTNEEKTVEKPRMNSSAPATIRPRTPLLPLAVYVNESGPL